MSPDEHTYLADLAHREEGGTPAIIEAIRAGLVFHLKQAVGEENIEQLEHELRRSGPSTPGRRIPTSEILGNLKAQAAVHRVVRDPARRPDPAPQLRGRPAERSVRHPGPRRLLVRRALRPPAAGHRPGPEHEVPRGHRRAAAKASSPAGCASTSTTSSAPRPSTSSSRRWT